MNKDELYRKIEVLSKLIETSEGEVLMVLLEWREQVRYELDAIPD